MARAVDVVKELREMKASVEKMENIVENRLVGEAEADELSSIREYHQQQRKGELELVPLRTEVAWNKPQPQS